MELAIMISGESHGTPVFIFYRLYIGYIVWYRGSHGTPVFIFYRLYIGYIV